MSIQVLYASPDVESLDLQQSLHEAAMNLVCFPVDFDSVSSIEDMWARIEARLADVLLLDWCLVAAQTPELVREVLNRNPGTHIIVLLPQGYRQYRQSVWEAGACSSIPKEHMDQEWLSSILCVMDRAMRREAQLLQLAGGLATNATHIQVNSR